MGRRRWVGCWCRLSSERGVRRVHRRSSIIVSSSSTNNNCSPKKQRKEKQTANNAKRHSALADRRLLRNRRRQARCRDQVHRRRVGVIRLRRSPNTQMGTITITTGIGNMRRHQVVLQLLLQLLPRKPHPHTLLPVQTPVLPVLHLPPQIAISPTTRGLSGLDLRTPLGVAAGMERCHRRRGGRWGNLRRRS